MNSSVRARRFHRHVDGILLLDKPLGLSSNEALQKARALYGALKAGHGGSLDPLASGMLPVCFGHATKVCGQLLGGRKTYEVIARLGERTASGDLETPVVETRPIPPLDRQTVEHALSEFVGEQRQLPPMHSAIRMDGKRLYELARRGESVEREYRTITIDSIRLTGFALPDVSFETTCSKGTYIRSLAEDLAARLGTVGHLVGLRRTSVSPFEGLEPRTLETLAAAKEDGCLDTMLLPADVVFTDLPRYQLTAAQWGAFTKGQAVAAPDLPSADRVRVYDESDRFVGLATSKGVNLQPVRLFVDVTCSELKADPAHGPEA